MKETKLIKMLKSLSSEEINDFEKFVDSPFFGQGRNLSRYFKCLKTHHPNFDSEELTPEKIFHKLYPPESSAKTFSENILHKLSSDLFKLCKDFLIHTELKKDEHRKYFYLLNQLRKKKLYDEFEKDYKQSLQLANPDSKGGVNEFIDKYFLSHSFLEFCIDKGDANQAFEQILYTGELITVAALIKGFRKIDTNNSSQQFNVKVRYNLLDNLIEHLDYENLLKKMKAREDKFLPYIEVSYAIHKMYSNKSNDEFFFGLKKSVTENLEFFGRTEKYILFQTMIGFCTQKQTSEKKDLYIREEFELIKMTFALGIYKFNDEDRIQINNFRTTLFSAIDNGAIDWLEEFVPKYINELHPEYTDNMFNYSSAFIHFQKKEYEKALDSIMKVKYDFFLFKLDVKNLLFRIYFELECFEQAYSMLDTMKHYLANAKDISESARIREKNFIKYAAELLKCKFSHEKHPVNLRKRINDEKLLSSRMWLLKIADE